MWRLTRWLASVALLFTAAHTLQAGGDHASLVPWEVLEAGARVDAALILFWIPATSEELRRSPLLTSNALTLFSSRCVAMRVVRLDDGARLAALKVNGAVPLAVLSDGEGNVIGRVDAEDGRLSVTEVEDLVSDELDRRAAEADALLDRARERAEARDDEAAAAIYREVWEERCLCPRQGREAGKALRRMGER